MAKSYPIGASNWNDAISLDKAIQKIKQADSRSAQDIATLAEIEVRNEESWVDDPAGRTSRLSTGDKAEIARQHTVYIGA